MIELLIVGALGYGFCKLCKKGGKVMADVKYAKNYSRCGTKVKPDGDYCHTFWKQNVY